MIDVSSVVFVHDLDFPLVLPVCSKIHNQIKICVETSEYIECSERKLFLLF